jgi:hypothetical protein
MTRYFAHATGACAALLLAACGQADKAASAGAGPGVAAAAGQASEGKKGVAPLSDVGDEPPGKQAPSYEVAIASAAADQNQAIDACAEKPAAERRDCKKLAQDTWEKASAEAGRSRGKAQL